jgi:hypothetical protein
MTAEGIRHVRSEPCQEASPGVAPSALRHGKAKTSPLRILLSEGSSTCGESTCAAEPALDDDGPEHGSQSVERDGTIRPAVWASSGHGFVTQSAAAERHA